MFPSHYLDVILNYLSTQSTGALANSFQKLSEGYRSFNADSLGSTKQDVDAYLIGRLPLTFAVISQLIEQVRNHLPEKVSIVDYGCGPATALLALEDVLGKDNYTYVGIEEKQAMLNAARTLNQSLSMSGRFIHSSVESCEKMTSDLAIVSYLLNELQDQSVFFQKIFKLHKHILLIEPGTPDGFSRIIALRELAIKQGFFVIQPCPHQGSCPMTAPSWCHFYKRVERHKILKNIKKGSLGYEDEKYSYVFLSQTPSQAHDVIVNFPKVLPFAVEFDVCSKAGLIEHRKILKKDKESFKAAKKYNWGDFV